MKGNIQSRKTEWGGGGWVREISYKTKLNQTEKSKKLLSLREQTEAAATFG